MWVIVSEFMIANVLLSVYYDHRNARVLLDNADPIVRGMEIDTERRERIILSRQSSSSATMFAVMAGLQDRQT